MIRIVRAALPDWEIAWVHTTQGAGQALLGAPATAVLLDRDSAAEGSHLFSMLRAVDPSIPIILTGHFPDSEARASLIRTLDLHAIFDTSEQPWRLREVIAAACARRRREQDALVAQELRELVVAKLCHDTRNYLHVIQGYAEILCAGAPPAETAEITVRLGAASGAALALLMEYLELSRLGSLTREEPRDEIALDGLLDELREAAERQIGERPIELVIIATERDVVVRSHEAALRAILLQLISHAIQLTTAGKIWLTVEVGRDAIEFLVVDDVPNVSAQDAQGLFAPYQPVKGSLLATVPGQGIGLALALRLAMLLGGALDATIGEPRGTVFRLRLPSHSSSANPTSERTLH